MQASKWSAAGRTRPAAAPERVASNGVVPSPTDYIDLKRRIAASGLLRRQPLFYVFTVGLALAMMGAAIALIVIADNWWVRMLDALFLAFIFGQLAFLGHDTGHRQVFMKSRNNKRLGLLVTLLLGVCLSWWVEKHNRHHSFPNAPDADPDIDLPVLAFSEEDAMGRTGVWRFFIRYQSFFFVPILALEGFGLRLASTQYMLRKGARFQLAEPFLIVVHFAVYFGLLFWFLPVGQALLFITIHHLATGIYLGTIFAPNHKGMPLIDQDEQIDFMRRQVLTARNIASHPMTDLFYGGQNFQIEHHLFPAMPRNNLRKAQVIIKAFCEERNIPYAETGVFSSYGEILKHLHTVSAPLRTRPA